MIATCVLPNIEAAIAIQKWTSSPHTEFRSQIEVAWILSTGIGLVLFLVGKFNTLYKYIVACTLKVSAVCSRTVIDITDHQFMNRDLD